MESSSSSDSTIIVGRQSMRIDNPFTLKVGQVFTGFGIGCGIGIGVGRPLNLGIASFASSVSLKNSFGKMNFGGFFKPKDGETRQNSSAANRPCAIPVLNQVMGATRGATDVFSGVGSYVNQSLRKLGAKNIEAGIGCGVGFGHGFGVGLAVKPGVVNQIQCRIVQGVTKIMMKFGLAPNLSIDRGLFPTSLQSGMVPSNQNPIGSVMQLATKVPDHTTQGLPREGNSIAGTSYETFASKKPPLEPSYSGRTEKVISSFMQNPILKDEDGELNELAGRLRSENNMLQMVLKHQQVIEELMKENEKLRQILVEDLKIPPSKLQASYSSTRPSSCADCLECRRKQRKK